MAYHPVLKLHQLGIKCTSAVCMCYCSLQLQQSIRTVDLHFMLSNRFPAEGFIRDKYQSKVVPKSKKVDLSSTGHFKEGTVEGFVSFV